MSIKYLLSFIFTKVNKCLGKKHTHNIFHNLSQIGHDKMDFTPFWLQIMVKKTVIVLGYSFFYKKAVYKSSARLLKKLRKFNTGYLRAKKVDKFIFSLKFQFSFKPIIILI